jgi:hypothetical protein
MSSVGAPNAVIDWTSREDLEKVLASLVDVGAAVTEKSIPVVAPVATAVSRVGSKMLLAKMLPNNLAEAGAVIDGLTGATEEGCLKFGGKVVHASADSTKSLISHMLKKKT